MKKYIFLLPFFLFSCKKNNINPKINIRQQPSKLQVFSVDTALGTPTLQYQITYFYNDSTLRFDSIEVGNNIYRFDYSKLLSENKILLNFTNASMSYQELLFDANLYKLNQYTIIHSPNDTTNNLLQFDSGNRLTAITQNNSQSSTSNYTQTYSYANDTIIINTNRPSISCNSSDTVIQYYKQLSTTLPYLVFLNINSSCILNETTILNALPFSNFTYNLPFLKFNASTSTTYSYKGDANYRLSEANIIDRNRTTQQIEKWTKIIITY